MYVTQNKELFDTQNKMHATWNKVAQSQKNAQDKTHATRYECKLIS